MGHARIVPCAVMLGALLLAAGSAVWADDKGEIVTITGFHGTTPARPYPCRSGAEKHGAPKPGVGSSAMVDAARGQLELLDSNKQTTGYCVKAYAVTTNKPVEVSGECGPVVAQRGGASRGIGGDCKKP